MCYSPNLSYVDLCLIIKYTIMKKSLLKIRDYQELLEALRSDVVISTEDAVKFYATASEEWKQTLLNARPPSPEVEKAVITYGNEDTVHLLGVLYGLYEQTIEWALREGSTEIAKKVVSCLKKRPNLCAEELLIRRNEPQLFKMYVEKFCYLEYHGEQLLKQSDFKHLLQLYNELHGKN